MRNTSSTSSAAYRCLTAPARLTLRETVIFGQDQPETNQSRRHVKVAHLNVNHLMPSIDEVNTLLKAHELDILCVGETFLSENVDDRYLIFPDYVMERCDRQSRGGGVGIIYRDSMKAEVLTVSGTGSPMEALWMRFTSGSIFVIGVIYRPPKSPISAVLNDLHHQLTSLLVRQHPLYVLGDVNIDLLQPTSAGAQQYLTLLEDLSLHQLITAPTRTTPTTSTLIDHILTSRPELTTNARVVSCNFSDHDLVAVDVSAKRTRRGVQAVTIRSTRNVNNDALNLDLLLADWSSVYSATSTTAKWDAWLQVWQPVIDSHMPLRTVRLRHPPCPWIHENEDLRELMESRDRAREARDLDRSNAAKQQAFRDSRNAVKKAQRRACADYFALSYRHRRPKVWTDIHRYIIASKKPEPRTAPLHHTNPAWAQRLNRHFVGAGAEVAATLSVAPQGTAT